LTVASRIRHIARRAIFWSLALFEQGMILFGPENLAKRRQHG
jgi:hypothetical protein